MICPGCKRDVQAMWGFEEPDTMRCRQCLNDQTQSVVGWFFVIAFVVVVFFGTMHYFFDK